MPLLGCAAIVGIEDRAARDEPTQSDAGGGGGGGEAGDAASYAGEETGVPPILIVATSLPGFPENEVPQGASNVIVVFTGSGFVEAMQATLGPFVAKALTVTGDSSATAVFDIPHGAETGAQTASLRINNKRADGAQIDITFIHAGGEDASDALGVGTPTRPYLTLKRAVGASTSGDTVHVVGTVTPGQLALNDFISIPAGVRVLGDGPESSILDGEGITPNGVILLEGASLQRVLVQNFSQSCVETTKGVAASLIDVSIIRCGVRALTPGADAKVTVTSTSPEKCLITDTDVGVSAAANSQLSIDGCIVRDNHSVGVWAKTGADVLLSNVELRSNGAMASLGAGLLVESDANAVIEESLFIDNPRLGVLFQDGSITPADNTHLTLRGNNRFISNGNLENINSAAIWLAGGGAFVATEGQTTFQNNIGGAIYRDRLKNQGDGNVLVKGAHWVLKNHPVVALQFEGAGDIELSDVFITGQFDVDLQPLKISGNAGQRVNATIVDLVITGNVTPEALYVDHDVKLSLSASKPGGCVIEDNGGSGVWIVHGEATIDGCEIRDNKGYGLRVSDGSTVQAHNMVIEDNGEGPEGDANANVYVNHATLDFTGKVLNDGSYTCVVSGGLGQGALIEGGTLRLDGCDIHGSGTVPGIADRAGLLVRNAGVSVKRSRIRDSFGPGVIANGSLTLSDGTSIVNNAAEGLRFTSNDTFNVAVYDSLIGFNGVNTTLPEALRSGVRIAPQATQGTFFFDTVHVTGNSGAGFLVDGQTPITFTLANSKISNNLRQGLLINSAAASIDLGCDEGCSGGGNAFLSNAAAFSSFQQSVADIQDARVATNSPFNIRDLSIDGTPLGPSQTIVSKSTLLPFATRWGFLKDNAGSTVVVH